MSSWVFVKFSLEKPERSKMQQLEGGCAWGCKVCGKKTSTCQDHAELLPQDDAERRMHILFELQDDEAQGVLFAMCMPSWETMG